MHVDIVGYCGFFICANAFDMCLSLDMLIERGRLSFELKNFNFRPMKIPFFAKEGILRRDFHRSAFLKFFGVEILMNFDLNWSIFLLQVTKMYSSVDKSCV